MPFEDTGKNTGKDTASLYLKKLKAAMPESLVEENFWLGGETTYRAGGKAAIHIRLESDQDFKAFISLAPEIHLPILAFGKGSNLLVADRGFPGIAVSLGTAFGRVEISGNEVRAGAAAALPIISRKAAKSGLTGFEWASGVPGTLGGGVKMNAGGHGFEIKDCLKSVEIGDLQTGEIYNKVAGELDLGYRKSNISPTQIISRAVLELEVGDVKKSEAKIAEIVKWRRENQPGGQNAGSIFKNPEGFFAGELLENAGAKGRRVRSAEVSKKHANFIQVAPNGSAGDVFQLMEELRELVLEHSGVELEPETIMVNFPSPQEEEGLQEGEKARGGD